MKELNTKNLVECYKKIDNLQRRRMKISETVSKMRVAFGRENCIESMDVKLLESEERRISEQIADLKSECQETTKKIQEKIDAVELRCKTRLLKAEDVGFVLADIEQQLNIKKKDLNGVSVKVDVNAEKLPNAYKYPAFSTQFEAVYKNGTWRIINIARKELVQQRNHAIVVNHTAASRAACIANNTFFEW